LFIVLAWGWLAASSTIALAQKVVLVPPKVDADPIGDAFNRLKAELTIHQFDVVVTRAEVTTNPSLVLTRLARDNSALAAIAFLYDEGRTSIQIWLVDRISGKTTMRALQVANDEDAASLLAIRTVDLLRASLREFEPGDKPPADVVGVQPGPVPKAVQALARPVAPTYALRVEALGVYERPHISPGFGPLVGASYRMHPVLSAGLVFAGPVIGARFSATNGSSSIRQEFAWAELMHGTQCSPSLRLEVGLLLGALLLQAQGEPNAPWVGRAASTWGALAGLQANLQWQLSLRLALQWSLRAMSSFPRLGVALGDEQTVIRVPIGSSSLGLQVWL
jgi:hypothetical protein